MKLKVKLGLLPMIVIAIALGVGAGQVLPLWAVRTFETINGIFSQFLQWCIPLIIVFFVAPAIADIGRGAGKMLVFTALLAYIATLCAGFFSYGVSATFFPSMITPDAYLGAELAEDSQVHPTPFFTIEMPPLMSVMTALVTAFVFGIGAARLEGHVMRDLLNEARHIVSMVIKGVIVPLLPLYIFGIFLNMTYTGQVATILGVFLKIIVVIFAMHVVWLLLQYSVAALCARRGISHNPLRLLWQMMPAYFTALGTQSSAATIPVTLERTIGMGVNRNIAGFTVPLCATIHLSGSTLKLVACALALMLMHHIPYDMGMFAGFIAMLGVTMVAAPGVPGGAVMAALGLFSSLLGFTPEDNALMIALYIAMDSFGTACNVTGDGSIAIIVDRVFAR